MSLYAESVFPLLMNRVMNTKQKRLVRSRVCASLSGHVVEIGFGTGLNLPHLPPSVVVVRAVDPLKRGRRLAADRMASSHVRVELVGLDGQSLSLDDHAVDAALSTWTLCSIPVPRPRCARSTASFARAAPFTSSNTAVRQIHEYSSGSGD